MKNLFIYLVLFFVCSCYRGHPLPDVKKQIVCYSSAFPFFVERSARSIVLPKNLTYFHGGRVVVSLFINDKGEKEGFSIIYLEYGSEKVKKYYDYSSSPRGKESYPSDLQIIFPFIANEIDKIKITKNYDIEIVKNKKYRYDVVFELK